jgi:hypothetical protein
MAAILTDIGEEYMITTNLDAESVDVGLYNDTTDSVTDTTDLPLSSEPADGNYNRAVGEAVSASDISGNWGIDNDGVITFDVSNTTGTVDSYFFVANFASTDAGDGGTATDHLVLTGSLSQSYDLSNLDTLEISAGTSGVTVN